MDIAFVVTLTLGLALGAFVGWLLGRGGAVRLQTELETTRAVHAERLKAYQESDARLRDTFSSLSKSALAANSEEFLKLAETRLNQSRSEATSDIEARRQAIEALLAPMKTTLDKVEREITDAERRRAAAGATLLEKIASLDSVGQNLRDETRRLTDALKRPGVRGRWGELQLKRVVELAGMVEHCHFSEQQTIQSEEGRVRPDVVIQLPGGKQVIVDAKVPLDAYLRALEAPDEDTRLRLLADHARQVRAHMSQLSAKGYFGKVAVTPEFVVMFLPGEMFFSAALEQDPTLIEFGVDKRVIPASPTTLIALLRAVAYGWQQEAVARDAQQIADTGRKLYESVGKLAEHFDRLGQRL
ncbi:MAG TPA: DNA recombination protein RmuC, partial [Polyangia bacterium]|nr:DNA recombination protein RmuC [Polyangia bacterium]